MTRSLKTLMCAALIALATAFAPPPAEAKNKAGAIAAGAIIGLAAGALIAGSANAQPRTYYREPAPAYYAPAYSAPAPTYYYREPEPVCYNTNRRVWVEGLGWSVRRVRVCE